MPHFLCRLTPPRGASIVDMSDEEHALMDGRAAYWRPFVDVGTVIAMGSVADPAGDWGLAILETASRQALNALLARDPAILANRGFTYQTYPMPSIAVRPGDAKAPVSSISP